MNKCIYKRFRTHKGYKYIYCTKKCLKSDINGQICHNCNEAEYKIAKKINKVSKKRIFVSGITYLYVFNRDNQKCQLCGTSNNLQLHHIIYRSQDKKLIDEPNNCIMLCGDCHRLVHSNKDKWQPILMEMNKSEINCKQIP